MGTIRKTTKQYEAEARRIGKCLVHRTWGIVRKLYQRRHGELPRHIFVCHTCDNPKCVLDAHHFPGTNKDNMLDAKAKGRLKRSRATCAKLSEANKKYYLKASAHEKASEGALRRYLKPAEHEKSSKAAKKRYESYAERLKTSEALKQANLEVPVKRRKKIADSVRAYYVAHPSARSVASKLGWERKKGGGE